MGIFKKVRQGMEQAADAQQFASDNSTQQTGAGQVGMEGSMPVDPAALGGPSSQPLDADDPMLQPVDGISIEDYAKVAMEAQARGVTDEAGMAEIAGEMGYDPTVFASAVKEWIARMGKSMVVGQQLRKHMGY